MSKAATKKYRFCPFCGGATVVVMFDKPYTWIECVKCFTQGPVSANAEEARERWNRRALPPADLTPDPVDLPPII